MSNDYTFLDPNSGTGSAPSSSPGTGGLQPANNLSDLANITTARTNLGLGSAATQSSSAFDPAGAAAATEAAEQSRAMTAEALALQKSANLLDLANVATARTNLGLGTAAQQSSTAFDAAGAAASKMAFALAWAAGTAYPANSVVTNAGSLYIAPSGGVPSRTTFTAGDWTLLCAPGSGGGGGTFGTTAGTYAQGNDARITGTPTAVTATGTTQSGAAPLTSQFNLGTLSAGNTAFSLQAIVGEQNFVNTQPVGGLAALIFPLAGSASINGLANTASVSVPGGTSCTFRSADGVNFRVTLPVDPMAVGAGAIASTVMVSGTPYTIPAGTSVQLLSQTTTQAAVTITLPSAPTNGQTLELDNGTGQITATTFSPAIAGWANGSALTPNSTVRARYFGATGTWQRTQ